MLNPNHHSRIDVLRAATQVSVTMVPNLFAGQLASFAQTLDLSTATVTVDAKTTAGDEVAFSIFVDAASDTIQVRRCPR